MKLKEFLNQAAQHAVSCLEIAVEDGYKMGRQTRDFEFEHGEWFARVTMDFSIRGNATGYYYLADFYGAETEVFFEGALVVVDGALSAYAEIVIGHAIDESEILAFKF